MYHNRFSVRVVGGTERDDGYVALRHGQEYRLALRNDRDLPCDAAVTIDGKAVGAWRIDPDQTITLERPTNDCGRFTFYLPDTPEGRAAGLSKGDPDLGLVSVVFTPGHLLARPLRPRWVEQRTWACPLAGTATYSLGHTSTTGELLSRSMDVDVPQPGAAPTVHCNLASNYAAGGTGLSGHSYQEYGQAAPIQYECGQAVTINLRLVGIREAASVRPLQPSSTPVPPPVE